MRRIRDYLNGCVKTGRTAMDQVETLREQARALRSLATPFETQIVRDDLLILAKRCEEMADEVEREIPESKAQWISG